MANIPTILSPQQPLSVRNPKQTLISSKTLIPKPRIPSATRFTTNKSPQLSYASLNPEAMAAFLGTGFALSTLVGPASAAGLPLVEVEPSNALSLPTWAIHVSSVVEWITAMGLVWLYGEKSGYESWKGLSWGMVPLLGGALCACTWHFFYNSESLEVLVALQGALTVIGNATMCIAAFRIYKSSQGRSTDT